MASMEKEAMEIYAKIDNLQAGGNNLTKMKDLEESILQWTWRGFNGSLPDFFCSVSFVCCLVSFLFRIFVCQFSL